MAFRFRKKEDFAAGFLRIADEQIARAQKEWKNSDRAVAVHETRKCLKRLRAHLRLFRPVLERKAFKRENARLRDIGRELSSSRDLQVMLDMTEMLQALNQHGTSASKKASSRDEALSLLRAGLAKRAAATADNKTTPPKQRISRALKQAGDALQTLKISRKGFSAVGPGLEETYRAGRKAMADVIAGHGGDEASHEWRKQVQAHWRQLGLLSQAWPELFAARVALARKLSEELGNDHDLAVLRAHVQDVAAGDLEAEHVDLICQMIDAHQNKLREMSLADGAILFAEKPTELRARVRDYWKTAKNPPSGKARRKIMKSVEGRFSPAKTKSHEPEAVVQESSPAQPAPPKTKPKATLARAEQSKGRIAKAKKAASQKAPAKRAAKSKSESKKNRSRPDGGRPQDVRS